MLHVIKVKNNRLNHQQFIFNRKLIKISIWCNKKHGIVNKNVNKNTIMKTRSIIIIIIKKKKPKIIIKTKNIQKTMGNIWQSPLKKIYLSRCVCSIIIAYKKQMSQIYKKNKRPSVKKLVKSVSIVLIKINKPKI